MDRYLIILIDSMKKKMGILDQISEICNAHDEVLSAEIPDVDRYNELMMEKGRLLDELNLLDDGFLALYERISPELKVSSAEYAPKLRELKALVEQVSAQIALIQAHEMRIKSRIDRLVSMGRSHTTVKPGKSDVAMKYYRTMNKTDQNPSIFLDSKK